MTCPIVSSKTKSPSFRPTDICWLTMAAGAGGGGPTPTPDVGLDFSLATAKITIPSSKGLDDVFSEEFTVVLDAVVRDNGGAGGHFYVKSNGATTASGIRAFHKPQVGGVAKLSSAIRRSAGNYMQQTTVDSPVVTGQRRMFGFVQGSTDPTNPGVAAMYVDGVRYPTTNDQTGSGDWETGAGFPLVIGQTTNGNLPINMNLYGLKYLQRSAE